MPIGDADKLTQFIGPEIIAARQEVMATQRQVRYKRLGLEYIDACKDAARSDVDGTVDVEALKGYILAAVNLLQSYHDAL